MHCVRGIASMTGYWTYDIRAAATAYSQINTKNNFSKFRILLLIVIFAIVLQLHFENDIGKNFET